MKIIKILLILGTVGSNYSFGAHIAHPPHESKEVKEEHEFKYTKEAIEALRNPSFMDRATYKKIEKDNPVLWNQIGKIKQDINKAITHRDPHTAEKIPDYRSFKNILDILTENKKYLARFGFDLSFDIQLWIYRNILLGLNYDDMGNLREDAQYILSLWIDYGDRNIDSWIKWMERVKFPGGDSEGEIQKTRALNALNKLKQEYEEYKKRNEEMIKQHLLIPGISKTGMEYSPGASFTEYLMEKHHEKGSSSSSSSSVSK